MRRTRRIFDAPIQVWHWHGAPVAYREYSEHGGGEDWVIFVPDGVEVPDWAAVPGMGCAICDSDTYEIEGGKLVITAHV